MEDERRFWHLNVLNFFVLKEDKDTNFGLLTMHINYAFICLQLSLLIYPRRTKTYVHTKAFM